MSILNKPFQILKNSDPWLWISMLCLIAIGLLMVYSTTAISSEQEFGESTHYISNHLARLGVGLLAFFIMLCVPPEIINKCAPSLLIISIIILTFVAIPGIGQKAGGARRWLDTGFVRVQPGEFVKIFMMVFFAHYISKYKNIMTYFVPGIVTPILILALVGLLYLIQPDLGSFVVVAIVVSCLLFTVINFRHILYLLLLGSAFLITAISFSPYRMKRFLAFQDPFKVASEGGYQLIQSLIAIGSGGFWGTGIGGGRQKLFFLPAAHTDFIYAMIGEEIGLLGALTVLILFGVITFRGLQVAKKHIENIFCCSLAIGCTALISIPAFLNMGVVLGLLPTKGMVLPFISYGGTALIVYMIVMAILLKLSSYTKM
ncbi:MAG: putative lipid II flippase FtsW [Deltaproteobacteria bacterium]|jgi:cell division protein FtsW|nr:putative lipid II flippase FtsW [Deltaproteobacteria bacterium]